MSERSGYIYELGENRFGLAFHKEQNRQLIEKNKVLIHVFSDELCTKPELNEAGQEKKVLKDISKLKCIGFSD